MQCLLLGEGFRLGRARAGFQEEAGDTGLRCRLYMGASTESVAGTVWGHWPCPPSGAVMGSAVPPGPEPRLV